MVIENIKKPLFSMPGKMTQFLKVLATHLENPDLILVFTWQLTKHPKLQFHGYQHEHQRGTYIHAGKTHTQNK